MTQTSGKCCEPWRHTVTAYGRCLAPPSAKQGRLDAPQTQNEGPTLCMRSGRLCTVLISTVKREQLLVAARPTIPNRSKPASICSCCVPTTYGAENAAASPCIAPNPQAFCGTAWHAPTHNTPHSNTKAMPTQSHTKSAPQQHQHNALTDQLLGATRASWPETPAMFSKQQQCVHITTSTCNGCMTRSKQTTPNSNHAHMLC
jgi:hypothetical protein